MDSASILDHSQKLSIRYPWRSSTTPSPKHSTTASVELYSAAMSNYPQHNWHTRQFNGLMFPQPEQATEHQPQEDFDEPIDPWLLNQDGYGMSLGTVEATAVPSFQQQDAFISQPMMHQPAPESMMLLPTPESMVPPPTPQSMIASPGPLHRDIKYDYGVSHYGLGNQGSVPQPVLQHQSVDIDDPLWTYAVEVWPPCDFSKFENQVLQNIVAIQEAFTKKGIEYGFCLFNPVGDRHDLCRRYTLPRRYRDNERVRLDFLQVFNANRPYNLSLPAYRFRMSVVSSYEPKDFHLNSDAYPNIATDGGHHPSDAASAQAQVARFSPTALDQIAAEVANYSPAHGATLLPASPGAQSFFGPLTPPEALASPATAPSQGLRFESETSPTPRSKPIPKPDREVSKTDDGKFYKCTWPNCSEEVKTFNRKCEWRCEVEGCEKLPGFTYSGGLLRHQREVHGQHGGPKNPLNCPHINCKRHTGKGFSRLENLNEHLRRVHTSGGGQSLAGGEEIDDSASVTTTERVGEKRKADDDLREEVKRLRNENSDLRQQVEAHKRQQIAMMQRIAHMQNMIEAKENTSHPSGNDLPGASLFNDQSHGLPPY
ncbi:hypothetical protein DL771_008547 [Monosporascus sp. 5C6A]|nr:hypothetical protein DL771_008547 [Monosporascus sp. 5C6A]